MLEAQERAPGISHRFLIDPRRTRVAFEARYMSGLIVQGEVREVRGDVVFLDGNASEPVAVTAIVRVASLATGLSLRDRHLRSAGYFMAERYPDATFRSFQVEMPDGSRARVMGVLVLRGVAREVTLEVSHWHRDAGRLHAHARTTLRRSEFGIGWTRTLPWWDVRRYLIADEVQVRIDVEAGES